jgi:polyphosphate kinase
MRQPFELPLEPHPNPLEPGDSRYFNRELSWLEFGARILELADDESLGALQRAKFFAIFGAGLDEFFQVRVAGLKDQLVSPFTIRSTDGLTAREQLRSIRGRLTGLLEAGEASYHHRLMPRLAELGIRIEQVATLPDATRARLKGAFEADLYPVLTPLSVDPAHPFPYISNLSLNLAVAVREPLDHEERFARIKVPSNFPRLYPIGGGSFVLLEDLIQSFAALLFPGMEIGETALFRVTRNTDLVLEEGEADDLLAMVETELRRRRFGRAVRLEIAANSSPEIQALLIDELELHRDDVYSTGLPLDMRCLFEVYDLGLEDERGPRAAGRTPAAFACPEGEPVDLFSAIKAGDILVHHPYDSFSSTVEAFVAAAARDPDVLAIKQTLYRTSGDSAIVESLIDAAEGGKQVVVIVEVKARFDELANIGWARKLEDAGVHVVYGVVGLKTHCKAIMVVRRESQGLVRYCHLGTGNYNAKTAKTYEDYGLFTVDPQIGRDLGEVFNYLTGFSHPSHLEKLILAPIDLRARITSLIERETARGPEGYIGFKVNGLVDPKIIEALYVASQAGVRVRGLVRGICALRPGVQGLSQGIEIRSIVGEFLEHSRIFVFGDVGDSSAEILLGSSDLMQRNLDRRVELLFPLENLDLRRRVIQMLELEWQDDTNAWTLDAEGRWTRLVPRRGISAQLILNGSAPNQGSLSGP